MKNRARIRCVTYGGVVGWFLRKHFSKITSSMYLELQYILRKNLYSKYINYFNLYAKAGNILLPCLISIETINRCNGSCEFCPVNRKDEIRPFCRMEEKLFYKIIDELESLEYSGYLNLYVNNEPLMDVRIEDWYKYAKEHLPAAKMLLYTNGTLMTIDRFKKIIPYIDKMIINNYTDTLSIYDNINEILNYVKDNEKYWNKDICIQIRYIREVLSNRAGTAPNKAYKIDNNKICIMPFTDLTIYPDGTIGLCCNDALEKTNLGNLNEQTIMEIWSGSSYQNLREKIGAGRENYFFCKGCDFVDAGIRNLFIKSQMESGGIK